MSTSQPGIFTLGTTIHRHLEFELRPGVGTTELRDALRSARETESGGDGLHTVVGVGGARWRDLARLGAPDALPSFPHDIEGVPSTQHDVWIWIHGDDPGHLFDHARHLAAAMEPVADVVSEVQGFVYLDNRDLLGFIDGTENPGPHEAPGLVCLPDEHPGAGGTYAMVQRWVHDLDGFEALPISERELVIGRTHADSVEIDDDVRPDTAHISRVVITDRSSDPDGEELEMFRRSIPYGDVGEYGLQFVGFAVDTDRIERMLRRMFGQGTEGRDDDGLHDAITRFSRPVSGSFYFVPSLEDLQAAALP